jgi:diguanylate cyclase (GGDEF)-like protein
MRRPLRSRLLGWFGNASTALETIVILLIALGAYIAAIHWDVMDWLFAFSRAHEDYEIDEVFILLMIMGMALCVFAVRRVLQLRREIGRREVSEARFTDFAEAASDWFFELDPRGRFTMVTRAGGDDAAAIPAALREGALWQPDADMAEPELVSAHLADLTARRPFRDFRVRATVADGQVRHCQISAKPVFDQDERFLGYRGSGSDVTVEVEAEARAEFLALHDPLTKLPNRVLLYETIERAMAVARRTEKQAAVHCLDLDRFKEINDTLGHAAGDLLIRACADRLRDLVREVDTVARLGGDEFAVVQVGLNDPNDANVLGRRILERMAEPFQLDGHDVGVTISIGIALLPSDGDTPEAILKHADIALYRAKQDGRNTFHFFELGMDSALRARKALEADLRHALERGEFEVHYQPLFHAADRRLSGIEALARWRHPERGLVMPDDFIPLAEETGLIRPLGEWVLRTACRAAVGWLGVELAVNLSPVQFRHQDLIEVVARALGDAGLEPTRLTLEITEGVLLSDPKTALEVLLRLRELGVKIAMDDFGTGYSSLSYLQKFPFDKIKIDRCFVSAVESRRDAHAIVRAIIGLGRSLGIRTCAEGVESAEQIGMLQAEGCDELQGYFFCKPLEPAEIQTLIDATAGVHLQPDGWSRRLDASA